MLDLTAEDLRRLDARGIAASRARKQLRILRDPPSPPRIVRACTPGDGIRRVEPEEHQSLQELWLEAANDGRVSKFVPASGAATRMFAPLASGADAQPSEGARKFWERRSDFAFSPALADLVTGKRFEDPVAVAEGVVEGLEYGRMPKALIPFHRSHEGTRTAFVEQLVEAAGYTTNAAGTPVRVHFTVGSEHLELFEQAREALQGLERSQGLAFEVGFSIQDPATDTLSIDADRMPVRKEDEKLLLRPSGHGALLINLERVGGDIVVVKNIDNVLPQERQPEVVYWKRLLIGMVVHLEQQLASVATSLFSGETSATEGAEAVGRILGVEPPEQERAVWLAERLESPLRVCGMVRNDGEPGGGPFWVGGRDDSVTPQIVEASQVDHRDPVQESALRDATHFNPVDLVCSMRNRRGEAYELAGYVDPTTFFVSRKEHDGRALRALERPGLWNGAMAGWNTVFVEVPATTFAPVKTVLDLLRPEHLPLDNG